MKKPIKTENKDHKERKKMLPNATDKQGLQSTEYRVQSHGNCVKHRHHLSSGFPPAIPGRICHLCKSRDLMRVSKIIHPQNRFSMPEPGCTRVSELHHFHLSSQAPPVILDLIRDPGRNSDNTTCAQMLQVFFRLHGF